MRRAVVVAVLSCAAGSALGTPTLPQFEPANLSPFFQDGPLGAAVGRLLAGDAVGARGLLTDFVLAWRNEQTTQKKDGSDYALPVRVRFLLGYSLLKTAAQLPTGPERLATAQAAAQHFSALHKNYPVLADYHALFWAQALLLGGKPREALFQAEQVPKTSVLDCDARFLRGEAWVAQAKTDPSAAAREQAVAAFQGFLAACPEGAQHSGAKVHTAQQLDLLSRETEALQIWRRLYIEAAAEPAGALAARRLEQPQVKQRPFSAAETLERALTLFEAMRNPESEAALRLTLEQPDLDEKQRCVAAYHLAQSVFKQRQRPRAAPLFDTAATLCSPEAAKNTDLHVKSLYQGARCHASAGRLQLAADLFAKAEQAHPTHSFADDSRLRQAEMVFDLAEKLRKDGPKKTCDAETCPDYESKFEALLSELPDLYPDGDRRAEALWRLAFTPLVKNDLVGAQKWLKRALEKIPREHGWDQEGRTLYWLGRVAQKQDDRAAALDFFRKTAQTYPLSFYAFLAMNRLRVDFPSEFEALVKELWGDVAEEQTFSFAPRALFGLPGFLRGVELLRLGLGPLAQREFGAVGIVVPRRKSELDATANAETQTERLWLAAVLHDRAGDFHRSHWLARHIVTEWQTRHPQATFRKFWRLAYPAAYRDLLTEAALKNGVPPALQFAIVREESAFDPFSESFANAIGLTQMIPVTAKRFAGGLPTDRESLRDPAINVAIGSRFLGFLWQTMKQNPALTISGYNAGEGAVFRWLRTLADRREIDLFIESIPYDETRGYTKRVLGSFLVYRWLEPLPDGAPLSYKVPPVPFELPPPVAKPTARSVSAVEKPPTPSPSPGTGSGPGDGR